MSRSKRIQQTLFEALEKKLQAAAFSPSAHEASPGPAPGSIIDPRRERFKCVGDPQRVTPEEVGFAAAAQIRTGCAHAGAPWMWAPVAGKPAISSSSAARGTIGCRRAAGRPARVYWATEADFTTGWMIRAGGGSRSGFARPTGGTRVGHVSWLVVSFACATSSPEEGMPAPFCGDFRIISAHNIAAGLHSLQPGNPPPGVRW